MGNILKTLKFKRMGASPTIRTVVPNHLVPEDSPQKEQPNRRYATNKIETTKYSVLSFLPKNLFEQFHRFANLYFVFIVFLNWIPAVNAFGKEVAMIPVLFVLSVTALKDAFEDYRRYKSDKKINNLACRVYSGLVFLWVFICFNFRCRWIMVLTGLSFDPEFISVVLLQFKLGSDFKQIEKGFWGQ